MNYTSTAALAAAFVLSHTAYGQGHSQATSAVSTATATAELKDNKALQNNKLPI